MCRVAPCLARIHIATMTLIPVYLWWCCLILSDHTQIKTFHEEEHFGPVREPPVNQDGLVTLKDEG